MIPEIDIWRVANLMLKRYGDEADIESAIRAEELAEVGDWAGEAVWRRIINAIGQLENTTPPGLLHWPERRRRLTFLDATFGDL
jgi:hypothetical protein